MKIRTKIKIACAAMGVLTVAATILGTLFGVYLRDDAVAVPVGWALAICLVGLALLISRVGRLRDREDAGSVKCECGGVLVRVRSAETRTVTIGRCIECGQHYAVPKRFEGNLDGGQAPG